MDEAVGVGLDILDQTVFLRFRRQQHFEQFAVWDGHGHVQVGDVVQRVAAVVDFVVHLERLGQMRRLQDAGDAALHRHIAAQVVRRLGHQPGRVGVEAARRVLGRHDWDIQLLA